MQHYPGAGYQVQVPSPNGYQNPVVAGYQNPVPGVGYQNPVPVIAGYQNPVISGYQNPVLLPTVGVQVQCEVIR